MKKILSVLLSLLMVVSCMTCLFTMPASAVEATSTEVVENLPENRLFVVEGNELTFKEGKALEVGEYYQLDVEVTTDDTAAKFYPTFKATDGSSVALKTVVGVRYQAATPGAVDTAYNYSGEGTTTESKAVENAAGTYIYTYIFAALADVESITFPNAVAKANLFALAGTDWDEFVWQGYDVVRYMVKEGNNVFHRFYGYHDIGVAPVQSNQSGNKTVSAKSGGKYYDILIKGGTKYEVNYNLRFPTGGSTGEGTTMFAPGIDLYETEFFDHRQAYKDIRTEMDFLNSDYAKANLENLDRKNSTSYIFGIGEGNYVAHRQVSLQYNASTGKYGTGLYSHPSYSTPAGENQALYGNLYNGYSTGNWMHNGYWARRVPKTSTQTTASLTYTYNGTLITASGAKTSDSSCAGRGYFNQANNASNLRSYKGNWLDATYTLLETGAQSIEEGYETLTTANNGYKHVYFLERNKNSSDVFEWSFKEVKNSGGNYNGAKVAPAAQDTYVALALPYLFGGIVYDYDNIEVNALLNTPTVKGKAIDGSISDIHANDNTTTITYTSNVIDNELTFTFDYDATRDAYGNFVGWFCGDELISTAKTVTVPYDTYDPANYTVVVEYENHLGGAGGFENTKNNENMTLGYVDITNSHPGELTGTASTTNWFMHDGLPTGDKWGMYATETKLASAEGYSADYPFVTQNGIFGGQKYSCYAQTSYTSSTTVTPYNGNAMLRVATSYRSAIKAIENLTPGKMYKVSFYTANANTNSVIYYAGVANSLVDINAASSTQSNTLGHKIISFCFPNDDYTLGQWHKQEFLFVATQETEYLHIRVTNPYSFIDELTCQEYVSDNSWDFEDGESLAPYSQINRTSKTEAADVEIVANDTGLSKLGNNYLKLNPKKDYNNTTSFNFKYNGTDKYIVSFDMKVLNFATRKANERLEMFLAKSDGSGYAVTTYETINALVPAANQPVVRTLENGKGTYRAMTPNNGSAHHLYHVNATSGTFVDPTNNPTKDNVLFEEWTHYEIVIDPVENGYSGYANFGWQVVGAGFELGIDNIKVEKVSAEAINAVNNNFAPTYAFNIRGKLSANLPQGLRFKSSIDLVRLGLIDEETDDISGTFANGTKIVEYGTIAATERAMQNLAATSGVLLRETAKDVVDDPAKSSVIAGIAYNSSNETDIRYSYENGVVTYTGVLVGIDAANLDTNFAVRAYVILENANGVRTVVYGDVQTLNMVSAANAVVAANPDDVNVEGTDAYIAQQVINEYKAYKGID